MAHCRKIWRDDLSHRADGDSHLHALGHGVSRQTRSQSLRLLGTVGEPINPEAWVWYHKYHRWRSLPGHGYLVADRNRPSADFAVAGHYQTETRFSDPPFPGIEADVVDENGNSVPKGGGGYLVLTKPWPAMMRTIYGDPDRFVQTYWSRFPGKYFAGDGCKRDKDGYFWFLGRVDDVMNSQVIGSARWRLRARWSITRKSPKPR